MPEPDVITSLQNSQVKQLVRLRSRREREAEGVILVEGARELSRALTAGFLPLAIYTCDALYSPEAVEVERVLPDPRVRLSREAFEKVSGRENPDGLLATLPAPSPRLPVPEADTFVVVLHGLEKPGNVGAILRTADAAGAAGVIVLGRGADAYSPNVIRASQGSVFAVPVASLSEEEALTWLAEHAFTRVACTPDAPHVYWDAPLTGRVALVLGAEHEGLPPAWRAAELPVRVPMRGAADSLNVATAAALVLYECVRQRR
ncbi:TrmH family RNA methyltransferase [Deinococcus hopiensis]|uniref:RNA methyltransferase, TrmH family n=1 Tax=Deinococcus hopiensis KR-140 TaxID=695939 RepID=A0A1W1VGR3_9DEIO|nr:RNA methyltransferase [Deinococcus hopiensis]SMB92548.1 RNA methyltransferase, TrmH family [Deinococcus hopiensis KR-140]